MKRKPLPDVLKGIAIILMIQVHIGELFLKDDLFQGLTGKISLFLGGPLVAPLFMLVMGYFAARYVNQAEKLFTRGVKLFLAGILLNIGLNFNLLIRIFFGELQANPMNYIFGVDILPLAGLSFIIISLLSLLFKNRFSAYILIAIMVAFLSSYWQQGESLSAKDYFLAFIGGNYSWSYFPLFPWLAYPLTGFGTGLLFQTRQLQENNTKILFLIILISGILTALGAKFGYRISSSLDLYYHHSLSFFFWTIAMNVFWIGLVHLLLKRMKENSVLFYIRFLGENLSLIYIIQWLLIGNIATELFKTQNAGASVFWFLGILLASSIIAKGYLRFRKKSFKIK